MGPPLAVRGAALGVCATHWALHWHVNPELRQSPEIQTECHFQMVRGMIPQLAVVPALEAL